MELEERMDNGTKFNDAWSSIGVMYPCQVPTFLGTSTIESDFPIIGFDKSDYRTSMMHDSKRHLGKALSMYA